MKYEYQVLVVSLRDANAEYIIDCTKKNALISLDTGLREPYKTIDIFYSLKEEGIVSKITIETRRQSYI